MPDDIPAGGVWLCLLFGRDPPLEAALARRAGAAGARAVFVAAGYEVEGAGEDLRGPMDYLDAAAADSTYDAFYAWQRGLPAGLVDGRPLADVSSPPGAPPAVGGWLLRFGAHMHVRMRFARFLRAAVAAEQPSVVCPVRVVDAPSWAPALVADIVAAAGSQAVTAPPERLLPMDEAWRAALDARRRFLDREAAVRAARGAEAAVLRRRLGPALAREDDEGEPLLDRLLDELAEGRRVDPATTARIAALEGLAARQAERIAAMQTRLEAARTGQAARIEALEGLAARQAERIAAGRARLEAARTGRAARIAALEGLAARQARRIGVQAEGIARLRRRGADRIAALERLAARQAQRLRARAGRIAQAAGRGGRALRGAYASARKALRRIGRLLGLRV
jgi:hypothetical protein